MQTTREQITPYITRDGSEIRELMHPELHGNRNQSLAEATIRPGCITRLHKHLCSEELYHVLSGSGRMTLGERTFSLCCQETRSVLHLEFSTGSKILKIKILSFYAAVPLPTPTLIRNYFDLNPAVVRHSNVDTGTSAASPSSIPCSTYIQYACAGIALPPCICTCLNVLGARTTAGFRS